MFSSRAGFNGKDENSAVFTRTLLYQTLVAANCRHLIGYDNRKWRIKPDKLGCSAKIAMRVSTKQTFIRFVALKYKTCKTKKN